jgi:hypothetical protein
VPLAPCEIRPAPLALEDGTQLYVEPEELIRVGSDLVVVGTPTYTWESGPDVVVQRTVDAHIAARFDLEGRSRLIEKPIPGAIGTVRAVALGGERWGLLFNEVHPDSLPQKDHVLGVWYAEHDGERWATLEPVPLPEQGVPDFSSSSELVRTGDGLAWVTAARLPFFLSELVHYERRDGVWRRRVVSDEWIEVSALAYDPVERALWMAHFSEDPALPGWQQSLRLHRLGSTWELVSRLTVVESDVKVRDPGLVVLPDGIAASWRLEGPATLEARARVGIGVGRDGGDLTLDPTSYQVVPLTAADGGAAWLVNHLTEGRPAELRVLRGLALAAATTAATLVTTAPNPYPSFFAALSVGREVVVVGPEVALDPSQPTVRSLILRLSTNCT